tara:strand:- start:8733 stop:9608 length:876 start_codon:yes stop_codon:yes gene_type:complete
METPVEICPIVIGASGLVGGHLVRFLKHRYPLTMGTYATKEIPGLIKFKLGDDIQSIITPRKQTLVAYICASLTNINWINKHPEQSCKVNVEATISLIEQLEDCAARIIFVSTDNVFRGDEGNYRDYSETKPVSEYGKQKVSVEEYLRSHCSNYAIIRLAKVIGSEFNDGTILNDIYNQLQSGKKINAATDLRFNPTAIGDIVEVLSRLIDKQYSGTFNFCSPISYNRFELTEMIKQNLPGNSAQINKVLFSEIDPSGERPLNTTMVNSEVFQSFVFTPIEACIKQLIDVA